VKVISGACTSAVEPPGLTKAMLRQGYKRACQTAIDGPAVIGVPAESMFEHQQRILTADSGEKGNLNPAVQKKHFALPPPSSRDARSDTARFREAVGDIVVPSEFVRLLPGFLRTNAWKGTAVIYGRTLVAIEPGDTTRKTLGVAFDIGTTTVVGTMFDLATGREIGVASRLNPQIAFGDDVISRIQQVRKSSAALAQLQQAIIETVDEIIGAIAQEAGVSVSQVYDIVVAGNSTMQQILCGFDPSALGEVPFVEVFDQALTLPAARLGIRANAGAEVFVYPQIGGFVGGDTVAGMVAARLDRWGKPVLLVDIGTNGEIVLAWNGSLMATSAAAGPAFEGARIAQGMRATAGAIEKIMLRDGDLCVNVIGDVKPMGLCGTALIDAAAELLRQGIIDATGRILAADEAPAHLSEALRRRLVPGENGQTNVELVGLDESASRDPILLRQKDVRELQLATGAIRAAITILLRRAGIAPGDLGAVLLAGAFGNFIRRNNARRIGLLPQIPCDKIRFIGNAASLGAKIVLLSKDEREYAEALRRKTEHVDLSLDPEFQNEFGVAMMFPETEGDACE
jgi:uncharacterized 2Fe-2S/4Fe-4S cluster protein (DUF4445 family)